MEHTLGNGENGALSVAGFRFLRQRNGVHGHVVGKRTRHNVSIKSLRVSSHDGASGHVPGRKTAQIVVSPSLSLCGRSALQKFLTEVRSFDGSGNNVTHTLWGAANTILRRVSTVAYADGLSTLAVRPGTPREISNAVHTATAPVSNLSSLSNMLWAWGQFLDHEIDLTPTNSAEPVTLTTPNDDVYPGRVIPFDRSESRVGQNGVREQVNVISAYIDGTNVYGSSAQRARALRRLDGSGKLRTSRALNGETLLPTDGTLENAGPSGLNLFVAGDIRANENVLLTAMHTLFVREHNRLCKQIVLKYPFLAGRDEDIYQHARRLVIGLMQSVTYNEFLPLLIGLPASTTSTYDATLTANIASEFSTVGYRIGHAMIPTHLSRRNATNVALRDAFFNPNFVRNNGVNALLLGATDTRMKEIDRQIVDDLRSFLFEAPTVSMLHDLAALNITRGRDHGLPSYNDIREAYGLARKTSFSAINTVDADVQTQLASVYTTVDDIDPWTGALCEEHVNGLPVGELHVAILQEQFVRLRDGDRFWFTRDPGLSKKERKEIAQTRLSAIIARNVGGTPNGSAFIAS